MPWEFFDHARSNRTTEGPRKNAHELVPRVWRSQREQLSGRDHGIPWVAANHPPGVRSTRQRHVRQSGNGATRFPGLRLGPIRPPWRAAFYQCSATCSCTWQPLPPTVNIPLFAVRVAREPIQAPNRHHGGRYVVCPPLSQARHSLFRPGGGPWATFRYRRTIKKPHNVAVIGRCPSRPTIWHALTCQPRPIPSIRRPEKEISLGCVALISLYAPPRCSVSTECLQVTDVRSAWASHGGLKMRYWIGPATMHSSRFRLPWRLTVQTWVYPKTCLEGNADHRARDH